MTVREYFERYIAIESTSDEESLTCPSTTGQLMLSMVLTGDLCDLGLFAQMDENGYVHTSIPASQGMENAPVIGLIAHMDTSSACSGKDIRFRSVLCDGRDIVLNAEKNIVLRAAEEPALAEWKGKELIVTDGTTLLGADDKAGIAEIMALCEYFVKNPDVPHGRIAVAFTPDEEIGRGVDHFDLDRFGADFAYTVDGGALGELEYENFNAAAAKLTVQGVSSHPGTAKGQMVNAALVAHEFADLLPRGERPELTEGYEGFYHLTDVNGDCETCTLSYIIRDHDRAKFEKKKGFFASAASFLQKKYPAATITAEIRDSYYNMKEKLADHMDVVERAANAMRSCGVEPKVQPIRGGTDGAMLSWRGLPCPNLSTGGYRFHSRFEFIPVEAMETMTGILIAIVKG